MSREGVMEKAFTAVEILQEGLSKGMHELGDQFRRGEIFLLELIFATEVMKTLTDTVEEEQRTLEGDKAATKRKVVIGTIEGDVHNIGKGKRQLARCLCFASGKTQNRGMLRNRNSQRWKRKHKKKGCRIRFSSNATAPFHCTL